MSPLAGYSSRSLADKLGLKPGMNVYFADAPPSVMKLIKLPEDVTVLRALLREPADFIHCFSTRKRELTKQFPLFKTALADDGLLWISWPKRAAKMETDLDENIIREIGLANGLVDVKVIAVDEVWSALKFVYRLKDRK